MPCRRAHSTVLPACFLAAGLLLAFRSAGAQDAPPLLAGVFQDHAVIQRDAPIRIWGDARAGDRVAVELSGQTVTTVADDEGRWSAELPALPAGGPYVLTAHAGNGAAHTAEDLLVGDVFLCAGQSNMVLPVSRTTFGAFEAMRANDTRIRMLTVPNASSPVPLADFPDAAAWEVVSPETVPDWSAACYYMGRDLRSGPLAAEDVPVGLITAAWGGSAIRSWMSADALRSVEGHAAALDMLDDYTGDRAAAQQAFGETWQAWWLERSGVEAEHAPWLPATGASWPPAPEGLGDWTRWDGLGGFTGMVWFRASVTLTREQAAHDARLVLGPVDEVDQTWINGRIVGNTFGYGTPREYPLPAGMLREGENVVVVNVLNTYAAGGLTGDDAFRGVCYGEDFCLPLGDWRNSPVRDAQDYPPRAPWESAGGLGTIHNAMVAPLGGLGLRGVAWYQGESDTGAGGEYEALLRALATQWRATFRHPGAGALPVLVVQLPNYGPWPTRPSESGWAEVREAQRRAMLGDPAAALVVTIDVGDPRDLHPANKQAVGARLARAARSRAYGESIAPSGPMPVSAERRGDEVVVAFTDVEGELVALGGAGPLGFELCGEERGSCRYVHARAFGREVRIRLGADGPAARVRHAWADSPIVTLFDGSGLPAGPFELEVRAGER
jgi:sialate O-acetylesterase